ncbi:hypothetical protein [Actinoallomurus iriomotensis]|uniref:hypothetical protein n=1 Tax=Actinoallomurus iriomotensis TaxID=478107 RepID=UPI003D7F9910
MARADTVERILRTATELGYRRNPHGASLRTAPSLLVGVIVPRLQDFVLATVFAGIDQAASERGHAAFVTNSLDDPAQRDARVEQLLDRRVDGLICATRARTMPSSKGSWNTRSRSCSLRVLPRNTSAPSPTTPTVVVSSPNTSPNSATGSRERGIAWVPYFPLGSGIVGLPRVTDLPAVKEVTVRLRVTPAQVGLAWLLSRSPQTTPHPRHPQPRPPRRESCGRRSGPRPRIPDLSGSIARPRHTVHAGQVERPHA